MVTDINRKQEFRRQYIQMAVFCSVIGLFAAFAAAVYFFSPEIDFSDVKQVLEGIREIKGMSCFCECLSVGWQWLSLTFINIRDYLFSPGIVKSVDRSVRETLFAIDANKKVLKGTAPQSVKDEFFQQSQVSDHWVRDFAFA